MTSRPATEEERQAFARSQAEGWPFLRSVVTVRKDLDDLAVWLASGQRLVIGVTHEGCETCGGDGTVLRLVETGLETAEAWDLVPCPDGVDIEWTVE